MLKILRAYGIQHELVAAIGTIYRNTWAKVFSSVEEIEEFDKIAAVLQVDTLALYLFLVVLNHVIRQAIVRSDIPGFSIDRKRSSRPSEVRPQTLKSFEVFYFNWSVHCSMQELCGSTIKVSTLTKERHRRLTGHWVRQDEEINLW